MSQDPQRQRANEQPATIRQLKGKFPDASSDFILRCAEEGWTIRQVTDRFVDHVRNKRAGQDREIAALQAKNVELKERVARRGRRYGRRTTECSPFDRLKNNGD